MIFKIALVATLCVAQGFAFTPRGKGPCKTPASEIEEKIPHDLEDAMHEMDEVTEAVGMAAMEAYMKGNDPDVIVECFREQKVNFVTLGQKLNRKMWEANREMAQLLGEDYQKYSKRIEGPLKTIGMTMTTYPIRMWKLIEQKKFSEALEVMKESRRIIQKNSRILGEIMKEMAEEHPECAERSKEISQEIREEARNGCRAIGEAFRKCVEAGGPNKSIQDAPEEEADLQEAPEQ